MSRCAEDGAFNRVLCVTLLAIAVTFTVILTNVFVDIDSLLADKIRDASTATEQDSYSSTNVALIEVEDPSGRRVDFDMDRLEVYGAEDTRNDLPDDESARTKRALDASSRYKTNPRLKKLLTRRLEALLEELDSEDEPTTQIITTVVATEDQTSDPDTNGLDSGGDKDENDLLRLAMHNILLDGVIKHVDMDAIYAEVHNLVECFKQIGRNKDYAPDNMNRKREYYEEYYLIQEMAKCEDLRNQDNGISETPKNNNVNEKAKKEPKKIFIQTIIDIATDDTENQTISENDIQGEVQITLNGKPINGTSEKKDHYITAEQIVTNSTKTGRRSKRNYDKTNVSSNFLYPFLRQYLRKYSKREISVTPNLSETNYKYQSKRMKRHIKLRFNDKKQEETRSTPKPHIKEKQEDEVFVEIKTHFNNKGIKGAKKNKLIKALIKKIENAIHADLDQSAQKKKSMIVKHWNIKKRTQDPIKKIKSNTHAMPFLDKVIRHDLIRQRDIDPITKKVNRNAPVVSEFNTNLWRKKNDGPRFLTASKAINSAETGKVDIDYDKVLSVNGIPKRLQQPLTTDDDDNSEDFAHSELSSQHGVHNYRFLIKNIDGTGFSIGLNSYKDGPPEPEAIKMFSSLESLIHAFRNNYVLNEDTNNTDGNEKVNSQENNHVLTKRDVSKFKVPSHDNGHVNTYGEDIFKTPIYQNYREILDRRIKESKESPTQNSRISKNYRFKTKQRKKVKIPAVQLPVIFDEQILNKDLRPSEILSIANLLDRKKRHMKLNKITNLNTSKKKSIEFLNTKPLKRMLFYNNKRIKRQIRYISNKKDDDVFGSSEENVYADRAVINEANNDPLDAAIMKANDNYFAVMGDSPRPYNRQRIPDYFIRAQPNKISSRYPHIFLNEQVEYDAEHPEYFTVDQPAPRNVESNEDIKESEVNGNVSSILEKKKEKLQDFEELVKSIIPSSAKRNYKIVVKVKPKLTTNGTDVAGFKEIHTSINKSFNKNGLQYFTLVNVSQISKIEKLNGTVNTSTSLLQNKNRMEKESDTIKYMNTMKSLLQYQKDAINTQLRNLQKENSRIDSIIAKNLKSRRAFNENFQFPPNEVTTTTTTEVTTKKQATTILPTEAPKSHLSADDVNNIIMIAINKFRERPMIADTTRRAEIPVAIETTTTTSTTSKPDVIANIILKNINLTTQILRKIDKNTDLLAKFLCKLHLKKDNYIKREYPTRISVDPHTTTGTYDNDNNIHNNILDPVIDKRSIVPNARTNENTIHFPMAYASGIDSRSDQMEPNSAHIGFIQRNVTELTSNLNKFFIDDNMTKVEETPVFCKDKVLSTDNLNSTNLIFH